jgi:hypothetical protein
MSLGQTARGETCRAVEARGAGRTLQVAASGYLVALHSPPCESTIRRAWLAEVIRHVHTDPRQTHGSRRVHAELTLARGPGSLSAAADRGLRASDAADAPRWPPGPPRTSCVAKRTQAATALDHVVRRFTRDPLTRDQRDQLWTGPSRFDDLAHLLLEPRSSSWRGVGRRVTRADEPPSGRDCTTVPTGRAERWLPGCETTIPSRSVRPQARVGEADPQGWRGIRESDPDDHRPGRSNLVEAGEDHGRARPTESPVAKTPPDPGTPEPPPILGRFTFPWTAQFDAGPGNECRRLQSVDYCLDIRPRRCRSDIEYLTNRVDQLLDRGPSIAQLPDGSRSGIEDMNFTHARRHEPRLGSIFPKDSVSPPTRKAVQAGGHDILRSTMRSRRSARPVLEKRDIASARE